MSKYTERKRVKIGNEFTTNSWQADILARALDKDDMKRIWDAYKSARLRASSQGTPPTKVQYDMVDMRKAGSMPREIAKHYKTNVHVVASGIKKVAIYKLLCE